MSAFIPAFEICLSNSAYTGTDAIRVNCGQWVTCDGAKGRVVNPDTLQTCWRMKGESFASFNLRFKKALHLAKGLRRTRKTLRAVYTARNQISMPLQVQEVATLNTAIKSLHVRINELRVKLDRCLDKADSFPVNSPGYKTYHAKAWSCACAISELRQ